MKRIICSILVVVMLALSLVSCGYSFKDDDMTKYATFSDADKAKFEAAIKKILIKDGDFTTDDAIREERVIENIYAAIASAVKSDAEKVTEGTPDNRDVVYYSYYVTADFDGVTAYFYTDKMKSSSAVSVQLRPSMNYGEDELSEKLAAILGKHNFDNYVYSSTTSGKALEGEVAYVTYTKTVGTGEPVVYTNQKVVIGAAPAEGKTASSFESYLCNKSIASSIEKFEEKDAEGKVTATYSSIKINWVSSRETNGTAKEGDSVYVSYTKSWKETVNGKEETKKENVTNKLVVVGAPVAEGEKATDLLSYLAGKELATTLDKLTITEDGKEVDYNSIKINWRANDAEAIGSFVDTTYDKETKVKDTTGTERDLKDKELTYYVYPVYFTDIPEYTATLLIDKIFGKELTEDNIYEILFVDKYAALDDDATQEEIDKIKEGAVKYKTSDGLSIADLVKKIVAYYEDIKTAETALDNATEALTKAETAVSEAQDALDQAKADGSDADKIADLEADLKAAKEALDGKEGEAEDKKTGAKANKEKAQKAYDKVGTDKENNIKALLAIKAEGEDVTLETKLYNGYKVVSYNYLQQVYNEEIKNKLAKEIYYFITENVTVNEKLPEDAVEEAYTQIYETYENEFYTGTYDTSNKISNYKQYGGDFDKFLIAQVSEDIETVKTVKEAKAAMQKKATESVEPLVEIYLIAQKYNQVITEKEYEEYKDELEDYYYYYILYYKNFSIESMLGETNIYAAAQFNKLMDWFLEYDEDKAEADDNGYVKITYKYKNALIGEYELGDSPASESKDDAE